ncbi:MAG: RsmD family RNA methyltransferase [Opitutales bacterium]|nr:RsmD family RNA methyltransferase [Opitutales bacterium]
MRITGGIARGIPLILPTRGEIRPATDYLREAVFSSLGELVAGASVLDCFAGTGAYSWEALSRGAASAILADKNPAASVAQKKNFAALKKSLEARGVSVPAVRFLSADLLGARPFPQDLPFADLIFCDPPWALWQKPEMESVVEKISAYAKKDSPNTRLILETPAGFEPDVPAGWRLLKRIGKKGKDQPAANVFVPETFAF